MVILLAAAVAIIALISYLSAQSRKRRRLHLLQKYGDSAIVDRILGRMFWQGQTSEQLLDSLGEPADIDEKVLKSKVRQTWKYHRSGRNRFGLRIVLENGVVTGWDQR